MATEFAPASDHARRLATEAASKAETAKSAEGLAVGKLDLFRRNPFAIIVVPGFNSRDFTLPENEAR